MATVGTGFILEWISFFNLTKKHQIWEARDVALFCIELCRRHLCCKHPGTACEPRTRTQEPGGSTRDDLVSIKQLRGRSLLGIDTCLGATAEELTSHVQVCSTSQKRDAMLAEEISHPETEVSPPVPTRVYGLTRVNPNSILFTTTSSSNLSLN